ncbi:MAG: HAD family hydrolase [Coriobacteriia bacterium]
MNAPVPYLADHDRAGAMLSRARVVYTDLDGTLFARGGSVLADAQGTPSARVAEAIVSLAHARLEVVPVSGRDRSQLFELCRLLGWNAYVAEAGGVLVHGLGPEEEIRYNNGSWDASLLADGRTPYRVIAESGAAQALYREFPGRCEPFSAHEVERESSLIVRGCLDRAAAQSVLDEIEPPMDILDNGVVRTSDSLRCEGAAHVYHIVPSGVSKRQAVELDLQWRGLSAADALAIGDAATDIQMAGAVGLMALVDNAFDTPEVPADIERLRPDNVVRLHGARGDGWAEFADAWVAAATR